MKMNTGLIRPSILSPNTNGTYSSATSIHCVVFGEKDTKKTVPSSVYFTRSHIFCILPLPLDTIYSIYNYCGGPLVPDLEQDSVAE